MNNLYCKINAILWELTETINEEKENRKVKKYKRIQRKCDTKISL